MQVESLMTKSVRTCRPEESLDSAARVMWDNDCGCVPVIDKEDVVIGVITDRDVCMSAWSQGKPLREIPIVAAMSWRVLTIKPADSIEFAEEVMRSNQVRRLPVVDPAGKLVGLLSLADIAREARREMLSRDREVEGIEVAATLAAVSTPTSFLESDLQERAEELIVVAPRAHEPKVEAKPSARVKVRLD